MMPGSQIVPTPRWRSLARESLPLLGSTTILLAALVFGLVVLQG